jgi:hypothetical protein
LDLGFWRGYGMINKEFEITGIEHEQAMVFQTFDSLNDFTLALASQEMELVK